MKNNLKKEYRDLEMKVLSTLREKINNSKTTSKFYNTNAIKINDYKYSELVIVDDRIMFLDSNGLHYTIFTVSLEELIDIIEEIEFIYS